MSGLKERAGRTAFRYNPAKLTGAGIETGAAFDAEAAYKTTLAQMQNSKKVEDALESGTAPAKLDKEKTQGEDWLLAGALEGLKSSKKYEGQKRGLLASRKNSAEYTNVQNYLSQILESMHNGFSENGLENKEVLRSIVIKYQQLDDACNVYLKKKGGETGAGKARKEQVAMIQKLIKADRVHLQYLAFDAGEEELAGLSGQTWGKVLDYARAGKIEEKNLYNSPTFGGNAKTGENAGRILDSGMFTKEVEKEDPNFYNNAFSSRETVNGKYVYGVEGIKLKMSNRNVAMSRVANLLGIGNLIEQSKTVRIHDQASGETVRGNLMTKAKGVSANGRISETIEKIQSDLDVNNREKMIKGMVAPSVQKELSSLQVLDYICGQGDRHEGNYFMESNTAENGAQMYDHIHGIDNDNAFSSGVDLEAETKKRKVGVCKLGMVVDSNDNLVIAHIDEQLAENIMNIDPHELEIALKDLIEPQFIDYTLQRLKKVKNAIAKEQKKEDSKILKDNQWNEKTHDDFMKDTRLFKEIILPLRNAGVKGDDAQYYKVLNSILKTDGVYDVIKHDSYYSRLITKMMGAWMGDLSDGAVDMRVNGKTTYKTYMSTLEKK